MRIKDEMVNEIIIERSVFICYLKKVFTEEEARCFIASIKKKHPDATHHCTAFILGGDIQRSNDDGEPSGTAGMPILQALKNCKLQDVVSVVVRYFGGIKLGPGGLMRAYAKSVSECAALAVKVDLVEVKEYTLQFRYDLIGKMDYLLRNRCELLDKQYLDEIVLYQIHTNDHQIIDEIIESTSASCIVKWIEDKIIEREIV